MTGRPTAEILAAMPLEDRVTATRRYLHAAELAKVADPAAALRRLAELPSTTPAEAQYLRDQVELCVQNYPRWFYGWDEQPIDWPETAAPWEPSQLSSVNVGIASTYVLGETGHRADGDLPLEGLLDTHAEWTVGHNGPGGRTTELTTAIVDTLAELLDDAGDMERWVEVALYALDGAVRVALGHDLRPVVVAIVLNHRAKETFDSRDRWPAGAGARRG